MKIVHLFIIFIATRRRIMFYLKATVKQEDGNLVCKTEENVVEWPVKNYSVITERDQNFPNGKVFAYHQESWRCVRYEP